MKLLTALLLLMTLGTLYAQGEYIDRGQNAYGISLSAGYHPKVLAIGASGGVSNSGTFDFGIGYSYLFGEEDSSQYKSTSTVITPFAAVHILKQSETNPVALSAYIQFDVHRFITKDETGQLSVGSWFIGGSAFHRVEVSQKFQIQPAVMLSFFRPERFPGYETPSMIPMVNFSAAFITRGKTSQVILRPSVSTSKEATTYSLSFQFVDLL